MTDTENKALWVLKALADKALQPFIRQESIENALFLLNALQAHKAAESLFYKSERDLQAAISEAVEMLEKKP
jgi:hypothetical protein